MFDIPNNEVPAIRIAKAIGGHYDKNFLMIVGGGLGNRACAEPTLRYCQYNFKGCEISLLCDTPSLYRHLNFTSVYTSPQEVPDDKHLPVYTYAQGSLANQFFNANLMHSIDFASVSAFRGQLPVSFKHIVMTPTPPKERDIFQLGGTERYVLCHVGKTWESRTFPTWWWESVMWEVKKKGYVPVMIGKDCIDLKNTGNVAIDLRDKLSLNDFVWLCKHACNVITNDSSPLHFASAGDAKIAFVPTCRDPDLLTHWRKGKWGWRMKPFFKNRMWPMYDFKPNNLEPGNIAKLPPVTDWEAFLPPPEELLTWMTTCP